MVKLSVFCVPFLLLAGLHASAPENTSPVAAMQVVSTFSVSTPTVVPGDTLKPGNYVIGIVDHLSHRFIIRITDSNDTILTTFLGLDSLDVSSYGTGGPVQWITGPKHKNALRGFVFPNGKALEFVYPKAVAVEIAKVNASKVPAIDPDSDNVRLKDKKLSPQEAQILTLWLLSSTSVTADGKSQPAIAAEHYQPPPAPEPRPSLPTLSSTVVPASTESQPQIASVHRPAPLAALPHTASDIPLILLFGVLSLLSALAICYGKSRYATS